MFLLFVYSRQILSLLLLLVNLSVFAGEFPPKKNDTTKSKIVIADTPLIVNQEIIILWAKKNVVAFVNWNTGGNNSISLLFFGLFST